MLTITHLKVKRSAERQICSVGDSVGHPVHLLSAKGRGVEEDPAMAESCRDMFQLQKLLQPINTGVSHLGLLSVSSLGYAFLQRQIHSLVKSLSLHSDYQDKVEST